MEAKSYLNYLRVAPRKMRLVADLVRNKKADKAQALLSFSQKKGAPIVLKLLNSCISNAKNNLNLKEESLMIKEIKVDEGPKLKRWRARSKGRAMQIQKKTSHVTLILEGEIGTQKKEDKEKKEIKKVGKIKTKRAEKGESKVDKQKNTKKMFRRKSF